MSHQRNDPDEMNAIETETKKYTTQHHRIPHVQAMIADTMPVQTATTAGAETTETTIADGNDLVQGLL